jgi:hypothetical protein
MVGSSHVKRPVDRRALAVVLLAIAFVLASALSAHASVGAVSNVLAPIQKASSDPLAEPTPAVSLGGDDLP